MRRALIALLLVVAACGEQDGAGTERVTAATRATDAAAQGEQDFREALELHLPSDVAGFHDAAFASAKAACEALDETNRVIESDAPNDTPESDAAIAAQTKDMALEIAFEAAQNPQEMAVILMTAGIYLCPDQGDVISAYIDAHPDLGSG